MCKVFPLFYKMRDVTTHSLQVYISLLRQLRAYEWISLSTEGADVCARPRRKASMPRRRHIIAQEEDSVQEEDYMRMLIKIKKKKNL